MYIECVCSSLQSIDLVSIDADVGVGDARLAMMLAAPDGLHGIAHVGGVVDVNIVRSAYRAQRRHRVGRRSIVRYEVVGAVVT